MEGLMRITFLSFLYGLVQLGRFTFSSKAAFNGKRPIFPFWDSEEKEIPSGFFEVLMTFDGKNFTSADGLLKIAIPTEEEESVHDFKTLNDEEDCSQFYLLFTAQELQDAGYNTTRSPGFNYWNPEAVRWEPRGHVLENSWADHRFYVVPDGYIAVCYRLNEDGDVRSENPNLPVFTKDNIETAGCFQHFFGHHQYDSRGDFELAYFFIELSLDELRAAGVEVPEDLTGFKFDPLSAQFKAVDKPDQNFGWDSISESWMPFCTAKDEDGIICKSGKLAFPWESSMSNWMLNDNNDVFTYMTKDPTEARRNSIMLRNFFSQNGGPYCDCNCFCDHCNQYYLPWEKSSHRLYGGANVLSQWTCD